MPSRSPSANRGGGTYTRGRTPGATDVGRTDYAGARSGATDFTRTGGRPTGMTRTDMGQTGFTRTSDRPPTEFTRTGAGPTKMAAMTGVNQTRGATNRGDGKETILSRLRPPAGFDDIPYRLCGLLPHHSLVAIFVLSLILGFVMIIGSVIMAIFGHIILLWFLGAFLKLIGAGLCMVALKRPNRTYILVYLTETIMETALVVLGLICVTVLIPVAAGKLDWKTMGPTENQWFGSVSLRKSITLISVGMKMKPAAVVSLGYLPMFFCLILLIVQIVAIYRFTQYVEDRNDFLIRRAGAVPVTEVTVIPPESALSGASAASRPTSPSGYRGGATQGPSPSAYGPTRGPTHEGERTGPTRTETKRSGSDTLQKVRNSEWVPSSRKQTDRGAGSRPPTQSPGASRKTTGPAGGRTPEKTAGYASVNPLSPSEVDRQKARRKLEHRQGR